MCIKNTSLTHYKFACESLPLSPRLHLRNCSKKLMHLLWSSVKLKTRGIRSSSPLLTASRLFITASRSSSGPTPSPESYCSASFPACWTLPRPLEKTRNRRAYRTGKSAHDMPRGAGRKGSYPSRLPPSSLLSLPRSLARRVRVN